MWSMNSGKGPYKTPGLTGIYKPEIEARRPPRPVPDGGSRSK